jgi:hypothetical protein
MEFDKRVAQRAKHIHIDAHGGRRVILTEYPQRSETRRERPQRHGRADDVESEALQKVPARHLRVTQGGEGQRTQIGQRHACTLKLKAEGTRFNVGDMIIEACDGTQRGGAPPLAYE